MRTGPAANAEKRIPRDQTGKAVKTMAMEAIERITQLEQETARLKEKAAADNRQRVQAAQREARRTVEQARQQAEARAREMMAQAEKQAAEITGRRLEQAERDCAQMKQQAQTRLEQAAAMIVEKVVSD